MVHVAWHRVKEETIRNCFRHAGLKRSVLENENDLPLSEWLKTKNVEYFSDCNAEDLNNFAEVDGELVTSGTPTDADIFEEVFIISSSWSGESALSFFFNAWRGLFYYG